MKALNLALTAVAALIASAAAAADTPGAAQAANAINDNRVICKKTLETGSLVKRTKQCFTKAEWDQIAETQRRGNEKLVDGLTTRPSGQ